MNMLRIGVIGAGSLADIHINAYKNNPGVVVEAICDINAARAREKAQKFNIANVYTNYLEMLNSSSIDAVSVVTTNNTHAPVTIAALEAGKNVLCEKPPAINFMQAEEMKKAAEKHGKLLMFGFVRRFTPYVEAVKEFIQSGELGAIYFAKTGYLRRCGNPGGWFARKSVSGGGPLIDLGIHIIDLCMYLMGKPKPISVYGNTYGKIGRRPNIKGVTRYMAYGQQEDYNDVEDFANAIIKFDNGASLYCETCWSANIKEDTVYTQLLGDRGGVELEPEFCMFSEKGDYLIDIKPVLDSYTFDFEKAFNDEINHFVDCVSRGTPCLCPADDGVTIMKILDAVYESAEKGEMVRL